MMRKVIIAIVITTADDCFIVSINQICKGPEMLNTSHDTIDSIFTGSL